MHLPSKDFRAYHIGANIQEGMRIADDAAKPVIEYYWKFKIKGEEKVITTNGTYPSVEGDFISVETKVIQDGYQPPIVDFSIESNDEDLTEHFLAVDKLIMIVSYSLENIEKAGVSHVLSVTRWHTVLLHSRTLEPSGHGIHRSVLRHLRRRPVGQWSRMGCLFLDVGSCVVACGVVLLVP